jgi:hypothetical protein
MFHVVVFTGDLVEKKVVKNSLPNISQILHIIANKQTKDNNAIKGLKV